MNCHRPEKNESNVRQYLRRNVSFAVYAIDIDIDNYYCGFFLSFFISSIFSVEFNFKSSNEIKQALKQTHKRIAPYGCCYFLCSAVAISFPYKSTFTHVCMYAYVYTGMNARKQ